MIVKDDENISYDKERQKVFMRKKGMLIFFKNHTYTSYNHILLELILGKV